MNSSIGSPFQHLICRVNLRVHLDRLHGRPGETQRFRTVAALFDRLRLQRAGERVRVVLQRDNSLHRTRVGVEQHDPAFEEVRGTRKTTHARLPVGGFSFLIVDAFITSPAQTLRKPFLATRRNALYETADSWYPHVKPRMQLP